MQSYPSYNGLSALDSCMQSVMLVIGVAVVHETPYLEHGLPYMTGDGSGIPGTGPAAYQDVMACISINAPFWHHLTEG